MQYFTARTPRGEAFIVALSLAAAKQELREFYADEYPDELDFVVNFHLQTSTKEEYEQFLAEYDAMEWR